MNNTTDLQTTSNKSLAKRQHYYRPRVDIYEKDEAVVLLANMPGVAEKAVDVEVENGVLKIVGRVDNSLYCSDNNDMQCEKIFKREFSLSDGVNIEAIEAKMKDGVLRITLPKSEKLQPRKIAVH